MAAHPMIPARLARSSSVLVVSACYATGCNALWGIDTLGYGAPANVGGAPLGGSGGGGTASGGAGGDGASGGQGGTTSPPCTPGESRACYSGPAGTAEVPPCRAGIQYCDELSSGFGPCLGEVVPTAEICNDGIDQDCSGADSTVCLVGDQLVVRYPIDEADAGQLPLELRDTAPDPMPLPLVYGAEPEFESDLVGNRGLRWAHDSAGGGAGEAEVASKVVDMLGGSTDATIEVVVDIDDTCPSGSPLVYLGQAVAGGELAIWALGSGYRFYWHAGELIGSWSGAGATGRRVLHAVLETTAAADDRIRCYEDGARLSVLPAAMANVTLGDTIQAENVALTIGNRFYTSDESIKGTIYYAAVYASALSDSQIQTNAAALLGGDDGT